MAEKKAKEFVPQAQYVFDLEQLERWKARYDVRYRNAYKSIRFEPFGASLEDVDFVLHYVVDAILGAYKERGEMLRGVLYVYEDFAGSPELARLVKVNQEGDYVAYEKG